MLRNNNLYYKVIIIALSLCLLLPGSFLGGERVAEAATAVSLKSGVTVSLYDAQLVTDEAGKLATYTLAIKNSSSQSVQLIDYWAKIRGSNNKAYITKLISEDQEKKIVIPNSTTYLTYYAYVGEKEQLTDLKIDMIRWDFGVNNYESVVGQIKATTNGVTAYKKSKEVIVNKSMVNMITGSYKMYSDDKYSYINVELAMRNKGNSVVDMKEIAYYLSDGKGTLIPLVSSDADLALKPQERKTLLLTATATKNFAKGNASIVVMQKDEAGGMNIPRVTFALPALKDTVATQANAATTYQIDGSEIAVTMKDSKLSYSDSKAFLDTNITIENKGATKLSMPAFEYYVKTEQGYLYPLLLKEEKEVSLLPKIVQSFELHGEIPTNIDLTKSQFVIFLGNADNTSSNFLGNYKISIGTSSEPTKPASNSVTYESNLVEQVSLQRIPNGMSDLLIAEFKVTNKGKKSQAKLDLSGQFQIDGVKLSEESTKVVNLDQLIAVAPDQSYRVVTYTEIPYTQSANDIKFSMTEKSETGAKSIHQFKVSSMTNAKLLGSNESYKIDTLGGRGEVSVLNSSIYNGSQTDMFFAQLEYENKEQRSSIPSQLRGYIENSKEDVVELNVKNYESKILPNGKAVLFVWAVIPKNYETQKLNLYIGESIKTDDELANVMINPAYTQYVYKEDKPVTVFKDLPFMQYDLTLHSFYAQLGSSDGGSADQIDLNFEYDLALRDGASAYSDAQSIVVEYVDKQVSTVKFSKSFAIGDDTEDSLQLGRRKAVQFSYNSPVIAALSLSEYQVNVYVEYENHKKLIATKDFLFGNLEQ